MKKLFTVVDPYINMPAAEYESYRGKLLAVDCDTGDVIAATHVGESEEGEAPVLRLKDACNHLPAWQWYLLAGPPTGPGIPIDDLP